MKSLSFFLVFTGWFFISQAQINRSWASEEPLITIDENYTGKSLKTLAEDLAREDKIKFYLLGPWADQYSVRQNEVPEELPRILRRTLRNQPADFIFDPRFGVFLIENEAQRGWVENLHQTLVSQYDTKQRQTNRAIERGELIPVVEELTFGNPQETGPGQEGILRGRLRDALSKETLVRAPVTVVGQDLGTFTDSAGQFSFSLPWGSYELEFKAYDHETIRYRVNFYKDGELDIQLLETVRTLAEVVIEAEKGGKVAESSLGTSTLPVSVVKQLPAALGEPDLIKTLQLLPGVQSVGEGSAGFNVRGGSSDQNLVLLDQAPIYNTSHLFGFFSAFNPEVVKGITLYKSSLPVKYGGRLSSVLEIIPREGNREGWQVQGGISPITGRLTVDGPLNQGKTSVLLGGRSTYSDWILTQLPSSSLSNSSAGFADANFRVDHRFNEKDRLSLSTYASQDRFQLNADTSFAYRNLAASLNWRRLISDRFFYQFFLVGSQYRYAVANEFPLTQRQEVSYQLSQGSFKADFSFQPHEAHQLKWGAESNFYRLLPGQRRALGEESLIRDLVLDPQQALESAIFISDQWTLSDQLTLFAGLRYNFYQQLGPGQVNLYQPGVPLSPSAQIDSLQVEAGSIMQSYQGPSWRFHLRYLLSEQQSLKLGVFRTQQFIHRLTNTTAISPTDTWQLSNRYLRPQIGDQVSLGYYVNWGAGTWEASLEGYYRIMQNIPEYKNGAQLLLNPYLETDLLAAQGEAYGAEFLLQKNRGRLTGWLSYTYARTFLQVDGPSLVEKINGGAPFPANFDQPHDLTLVMNYNFSRRARLASTTNFRSGRPITIPTGRFQLGNNPFVLYSDRNEFRVPYYLRWDLALTLESRFRRQRSWHSSWTFSLINVLGRNNVFSIFFVNTAGEIDGFQLSIFADPLFSATYNFSF